VDDGDADDGPDDGGEARWVVEDGANQPLARDDAATTPRGSTIVIEVIANDAFRGAEVDLASLRIIEQPQRGLSTAAANPDGTVTFTAQQGFNGEETFRYEVCDTAGRCSTATVRVEVTR
jgi:hypothetical protein